MSKDEWGEVCSDFLQAVRICELLEKETEIAYLCGNNILFSDILKIDVALFVMNIGFLQKNSQKAVQLISSLMGGSWCVGDSIDYARRSQGAGVFDPPLCFLISVRYAKRFPEMGSDVVACFLKLFTSLGNFLLMDEENTVSEMFIRRYVAVLRYYAECFCE